MRQSWYEAAKRNLAADERLSFYEACFDYCFYNEKPQSRKVGDKGMLMFDMIVAELDEDKDKVKRIQERNAANGRLGGRPMQQKVTNPVGFSETQKNPSEPKETQKTPIQYNTLQNITIQAADAAKAMAAGGGDLDLSFFDAQLWPRLDPNGEFKNRHRKCAAAWSSYTLRKRTAITQAVLQDAFAGNQNPFFYMEDFKEPGAHYLSDTEKDQEWKAGRSVYLCKIADGAWKAVSQDDFVQYGLSSLPFKEMKPMN